MVSNSAWQVIVATDVVDSTSLCAQGSDHVEPWREHDRLARDLIRRFGGLEIGRTDGVITLFDDARAAMAFAEAYHAGLSALPRPMQARVGVHAGPVLLRHNAVEDVAQGAVHFEADGPVLPVAVRLQSLALPRQTLLSREVHDAMVDDARLRSHGHWRLKGVDAPVQIFEHLAPGTAPRRPTDVAKAHQVEHVDGFWRPVSVGRVSLPRGGGGFVGRADVIAEVAGRFDDGAQLVTLLGPGGVGKTRLAVEFVQRGPHYFEGGVWFCDLAAARDADGVLQAVAHGLDVPLAGSDALQTLGHAIASRGRCLLLLDNAENVVPATAELLPVWQKHARNACILATSRVVLRLPGESVVPVKPLPVGDACALFVARARDAGIPLAPSDLGPLPNLAEALDRLPLALELAAARAAALPPAQQLARMDSRHRWLTSAPGQQRPARHGTLSAVFAASWELLSPLEQRVLVQLTVFEGGFDLAAAEAIVDADGEWVGDMLAALAAQSLLPPAQRQRHTLLRTVRDEVTATATLSTALAAAADAARQRHARHFAALGESEVLSGGFADLENLVAACEAACAQGDGALATRALTLCAEVLLVRGPARRLLALAEHTAGLSGLADADRAEVLRVRGNALYQLGRAEEALADYEHGLALATRTAQPERRVRLACAVAVPWARAGRSDAALALLDDVTAVCSEALNGVRRCTLVNARGSVLLALQRPDQALQCFTQALAWARHAAHRQWEGGAHGNVGAALYMLGRQREALHHFERAHAIACEVGDRAWAANAQCNRGLLQMELGETGPARAALDDALRTAQDIGQAALEATAGCNLGLLWLAEGSPGQAIGCLQDAAALAHRLVDHALAAQCERALAEALEAMGDNGAALSAVSRAVDAATAAGDMVEQARGQLHAARLHHAAGRNDVASQVLGDAQRAFIALPADVQAQLGDELARMQALVFSS